MKAITAILVLGMSLFLADSAWAQSPAAEEDRAKDRPEGGADESKPELSAEERERIRAVMQQVWSNPAVIQARDEVNSATETYKRALRKAVESADPEVARLMERMYEGSKSHAMTRRPGGGEMGPGGRPPGAGGPGGRSGKGPKVEGDGRPAVASNRVGVFEFLGKPPFYSQFDEQERGRYDAAFRAALESGVLGQLQEDFQTIREEDETLRKRRIQMFRNAREALFKAMVEADPEVGELLMRHSQERSEGEGDRPGSGEGRGRPEGAGGPGGPGPEGKRGPGGEKLDAG